MSSQRWYTKEDVIQDLTHASGKPLKYFDDQFVVVGGGPPKINENQDNEAEGQIELLYGTTVATDTNESDKPDLEGITHMLRMVDEYSRMESLSSDEDTNKLEDCRSDIIIISKLNPSVPDFIPRKCNNKNKHIEVSISDTEPSNARKSKKKTDKVRINETRSDNDSLSKNKETEENKLNLKMMKSNDVESNNEKINNEIIITNLDVFSVQKRLDLSSLTQIDKDRLRESLKTKISDTSKTNCVKIKRQRNLAIATLMKLCSNESPKTIKETEKPKLMTPSYFEISHEIRNPTFVSDRQLSPSKHSALCQHISNEYINDDWSRIVRHTITEGTVSGEKRNTGTSISNGNPSSNEHKTILKQSSTTFKMTAVDCVAEDIETTDIMKSVEKVDKWLNRSKENSNKSPSLVIGPITFKKKEIIKPATPPTFNDPACKDVVSGFVPSAYANELSKKFADRMKAKEANVDLWTKLESDLKARDEKIKTQKRELANKTNNSNSM